MSCATCKHWGDYEDTPTDIKVGKCKKVPMFWDSTEWEDVNEDYVRVLSDEENKASVQDGSDYYAYLLTLADFGCVQHEQM